MDIKVEYISAGLARCERNGMSESGAIATINAKRYYFSIYSVRDSNDGSLIKDFLEIRRDLKEAFTDSEFPSLLEFLHKEIELQHRRPLIIDLSKCTPA